MLSLIICSRKAKISNDLFENIKSTIGCEFELIVIDNSHNRYSIFEAYNSGIQKSKGQLLCFLHDDIALHTPGWGNMLMDIFNFDPTIGLLGVAGAKVKTRAPSAWWDCPQSQRVINIIQHFPNKETEKWMIGFKGNSPEGVVAIDGVFMAMRKDGLINFHRQAVGFHNYDFNISMEYVRYGYRVVVTNQILIEHFSLGSLSGNWVDSTVHMHKVYENMLPLTIGKYGKIKRVENANAKHFIAHCLKFDRTRLAYSLWLKYLLRNPISLYHLKFQLSNFRLNQYLFKKRFTS